VRRILAIALALVVLLAAACGGNEESATENWAGDVCSAVASWQSQVQQIFGDVQAQVTSGDAGAVDAIRAGIDQGVEATKELGNTLKGLGPPETEAGQEAQQQLEAAADQVNASIAQVQASIAGLGGADIQQLISSLSGLVVPLQAALGQVQAAVDTLRDSASDEIRQGFENAESCQELQNQTTDDS
jgi:hypothetical protein